MNIKEYPIIQVYLDEIEKLAKLRAELPLIFLIGATSELILREIMNDPTTGMEKLIEKSEKAGKITHEQSVCFDDLRLYRNKYTHISAGKMLSEDFSGLYVEHENGLLNHVNEIFFNEFTDDNLRKVFTLHIAGDSNKAYSILRNLVRMLE